jgi:hypothetical protein
LVLAVAAWSVAFPTIVEDDPYDQLAQEQFYLARADIIGNIPIYISRPNERKFIPYPKYVRNLIPYFA